MEIFNETHYLNTTTAKYISFSLTPFLKKSQLIIPRFRIYLHFYDGAQPFHTYDVKRLLLYYPHCNAPFLVVTTNKKQELAYVTNIIERKRRGNIGFNLPKNKPHIRYTDVTELEQVKHKCRKVKFELNLADIGWDSWMLQPENVDIGMCKGTCNEESQLIPHALAKYKIKKLVPDKDIGAVCCQETSYKEIVALYYIDDSLVKSILPQFIVNSCKCR